MCEFFRGWRRKTGCVTLFLALAFTGGWVRSLRNCDTIDASVFQRTYELRSDCGYLCWSGWSEQESSGWPVLSFTSVVIDPTVNSDREQFQAMMRIAGLYLDRGDWAIPYWAMDCALSVLSAYLLLPKQQKAKTPSLMTIISN